jgi:myosin heavy subunit
MNEIELWESEIEESNRYHHFENLSESINLLTESIAIDTRLLDTLDESTDITTLNEGILGSLKEKILKALGAIKKFFMSIIEKIKGFVSKSKKEMKEKEEKHEKEEKEAKEKLQKTVDNLEQNEDTKGLAKDIKDAMNSADASYKNIQTAFNIINNENKKTSDQLKDSKDKLDKAKDELNKTKNDAAQNISDRHKASWDEIKKSMENIKKNSSSNPFKGMLEELEKEKEEKLKKFVEENKPIMQFNGGDLFESDDVKDIIDDINSKNKTSLERTLKYFKRRLERKEENLIKSDDISYHLLTLKNKDWVKDQYERCLKFIDGLSNRDMKVIVDSVSKLEGEVAKISEDDKDTIECYTLGIKILNLDKELTSRAIVEITKQSRVLKKWLDIVE